MENVAIVLAAGAGKRMNSNIPKQYMELKGKPVLYYSLKVFQDSFIDRIVLVCRPEDADYCRQEYVEKYAISKITDIVLGGAERYNSVMNALATIDVDGYVYIHDGARPFINADVLFRLKESLDRGMAAIAAVPVKDTIKIADANGQVIDTPDRNSLYQIQTPQAFDIKSIKAAYAKLAEEEKNASLNIKITDDAMVMEHFGEEKVYLVMGDYNNIKITTPEDVILGNAILG